MHAHDERYIIKKNTACKKLKTICIPPLFSLILNTSFVSFRCYQIMFLTNKESNFILSKCFFCVGLIKKKLKMTRCQEKKKSVTLTRHHCLESRRCQRRGVRVDNPQTDRVQKKRKKRRLPSPGLFLCALSPTKIGIERLFHRATPSMPFSGALRVYCRMFELSTAARWRCRFLWETLRFREFG